MWQSIVKVAYKPEFSASFKKFIRDNVSPEFIDADGEGHQFFVPAIEDLIHTVSLILKREKII